MIDAGKIADVLGVDASTLGELARAVEAGLPRQALRRTAGRVFTDRANAQRLVFRVVPEATFKRRTRLSVAESERTERIARVVAAAEFAWDDREQAREWLSTEHPELDGRTPLQSAMSELGARRVENLLERIFYGLPV